MICAFSLELVELPLLEGLHAAVWLGRGGDRSWLPCVFWSLLEIVDFAIGTTLREFLNFCIVGNNNPQKQMPWYGWCSENTS